MRASPGPLARQQSRRQRQLGCDPRQEAGGALREALAGRPARPRDHGPRRRWASEAARSQEDRDTRRVAPRSRPSDEPQKQPDRRRIGTCDGAVLRPRQPKPQKQPDRRRIGTATTKPPVMRPRDASEAARSQEDRDNGAHGVFRTDWDGLRSSPIAGGSGQEARYWWRVSLRSLRSSPIAGGSGRIQCADGSSWPAAPQKQPDRRRIGTLARRRPGAAAVPPQKQPDRRRIGTGTSRRAPAVVGWPQKQPDRRRIGTSPSSERDRACCGLRSSPIAGGSGPVPQLHEAHRCRGASEAARSQEDRDKCQHASCASKGSPASVPARSSEDRD